MVEGLGLGLGSDLEGVGCLVSFFDLGGLFDGGGVVDAVEVEDNLGVGSGFGGCLVSFCGSGLEVVGFSVFS